MIRWLPKTRPGRVAFPSICAAIVLALTACGGDKIGFDCPGSPGWFQVSYEARLPVCAELLADPQAVCWEADRIASAGSAWGANGAPFTLWLPTYTDSLTWLGSPGCATTVEEAVSIATSEGSFG